MKPPPNVWKPPALRCLTCGQPVRMTVSGWEHVRRLLHRDWHLVRIEGLVR